VVLNGTIRRTLCIVLGLVLVMLVALSAGALTGLASYRRLVRELNFSISEVPRRADLAEGVGSLFEPLSREYPATEAGAGAQRRDFEDRLAKARARFADFHRRLDQLPSSRTVDEFKRDAEPVLGKMDAELEGLERDEVRRLGDLAQQKAGVAHVLQRVARLQTLSRQMPDFQSGMIESLNRAKDIYNSRIRIVIATTCIVLVLFAILAWVVYAGILVPVQKLHQGAIRVADGDFWYQLDLPRRGEMTELAAAFNKMTARFQESQQDLNRQVEERSRQLMRSERLANIGFLAAGVAHEINNPLSAISMAAESLSSRAAALADAADPDEAKAVATYLAMIRRESERCEQITRKLLDFASGKDGRRERVDLTRLVHDVLDMVRPMGRYRSRNIEFFRTQPCYAEVNGPEIKQVVLNIVSNALESMEDGGTLRIRFTEQVDSVHLLFEDDGCGMTDDVLRHLFEPFFTRRKDGRGTGLGMAISQRIIGDHHGTLEAASAGPKQGSVFRIRLPKHARAAEAA
jgi:two-component system, NtrC family, sensor kinase